jgi:hypothetical protein
MTLGPVWRDPADGGVRDETPMNEETAKVAEADKVQS